MNIREVLENSKVIAIIGFSDNHTRPSNRVGRYLSGNEFVVYGVNPKLENKVIDEIQCFARIADLPEPVDIVNIFRRSDFVLELMTEILQLKSKPKAIWTQIGVISNEAHELSNSNNIFYIENKCIMTEHASV